MSQREDSSLNKATICLLQSSLAKPATNTDFDQFLGIWSADQANQFDSALPEMRKVDPAEWEPLS